VTSLIFAVFLALGCTKMQVEAQEETEISQETVYQRIVEQKENYPEGMAWTDDDSYSLSVKLDGYNAKGTGCAGFAFLMSDAGFGEGQYPARTYDTFDNIRVGDIIYVNNGSHCVVVLEISGDNVKVTEGNYNGKIHWDRIISLEKLKDGYADYGITRYPVEYSEDTSGYCGGIWNDTYQGTNLTWELSDDGFLTIEGTGIMAKYSGYEGHEAPWYGSVDKIKKIVIGEGVTSIGACAFSDCVNCEEVSVSDTVETVGGDAFYCCKSLKKIEFPDSVTDIEQGAMYGCESLVEAKLPNGITKIPRMMFGSCKSLSHIDIPDSVTEIDDAFDSCRSLKAIYVPGSVTEFPEPYQTFVTMTVFCEDDSPLLSVKNLSKNCCPRSEWTGSCGDNMSYSFDISTCVLTISGGGKATTDNIFKGYNGVKQVKLENFTGTELPDDFRYWESLESFEVPDGVTNLEGTFSGCSNLQYVVVPASVTRLRYAFMSLSDDFVIKGYAGSAAESYAASQGIKFEKIGDSDSGSSETDGWRSIDGKEYWYEGGVRQGYNPDDASYRGKEIYDPGTNAWYWLDNVQDGAKAVSKDVYQESAAGPWADRADGTGKWVRYDENGHMVKGWQNTDAGTYYFDLTYGTMAKGYASVDGEEYYFDPYTGVLQYSLGEVPQNGWRSIDGKEYWYEDYQRQGYSVDGAYRGKEIYDSGTDAWYWLDNVQGGAKAVSKDVYQESGAGDWAENEDGTGKWVRYDENGHMIKGWQYTGAGAYYFDLIYGTMAKGTVNIDGFDYNFDMNTGILVN